MKRTIVAAGLVLVSGCAAPLPGSENVVMTVNPALVAGCQQLGQVDADQIMFGGSPGRDDVRQRLRNAAVERGATHVLSVTEANVYQGTSSATGELYRCSR